MNTPHRVLWAATAALLLVGAAPTAEIEDLVNEDDLEDFLVEPIPNPLE